MLTEILLSRFQLAFVNSAINAQCTNLIPGQVCFYDVLLGNVSITINVQLICLGIVGQDCTAVHVVLSGENCFEIANSVGIPLNILLTNNPNVNADCTNLVVGEVSTSRLLDLCVENYSHPALGSLHLKRRY